eukprot:Seg2302.4 transcript_id=Seg2302.4/GoldUCD/mRNA.D3Y31 product="Asparagine-tRNA ligase cytoplasmic" protein_id=Seg2302.4/GoldUCD/D3Y31
MAASNGSFFADERRPQIYTSEKNGNDQTGDGSEEKPFKTALQAMRFAKTEPLPDIMVDGKEENTKFEKISKSQLKKVTGMWKTEQKKEEKKAEQEAQKAAQREKNLEEAKQITIQEDKSLPTAKQIKIRDTTDNRDSRVKIFGWVHRLRQQGDHYLSTLLFGSVL